MLLLPLHLKGLVYLEILVLKEKRVTQELQVLQDHLESEENQVLLVPMEIRASVG